jgi:hypothetical protein
VTDEERTIITSFIERVSGAVRPAPSATSVPATVNALPPIDPEADRLISDLFTRYPEARYRLTQTAFVQEHALTEAQSRINALQAELQSRAAQPTPAPQAPSGFFHNLFGQGGQQQQQAPQGPQPQPYQPYPQQQSYQPQPQYAPPQYAPPPGMFQRSGSGFLGSALTTAAGVAGGMVAGNALMNLFEGNRGYGGGFGGGGFGGPGYEQGNAQGPWEAPQQDAQVTGSAWDNATETGPSGWDQATPDPGVSDPGAADPGQGGGWDDGSGGGWDQGNNNNTF